MSDRQIPEHFALIALVLLVFSCASIAQEDASPARQLQMLQQAGATDPQAWRLLAIEARSAGELDIAALALERAESLGLPPVNVGFERARLWVTRGDTGAAVAELQKLVDGGFSAIAPITGDPVLGKLSGDSGFDALIEGMAVKAYPCAHQQRFRDFDFWAGNWNVHLANGTLAGTNSIEPAEQGCVLIEKWRSASGGSGHSINYLDGATGEWVQLWNDASGTQIDIRGNMTDAGMRLSGQIHYLGNGTTLPFRALWTPLPDGRVRQFFEQSADGGTTWTPWFEGFYSRREAADK